jgi:hypothetical protein
MLELYCPAPIPPQTILQVDRAPSDFCHHVRNHLDREKARRWIGRIGPIAWPDLTPLDFFLWGYVKNIVYQVKMNDLQHLKARITDAVATVTCFKQRGTRSNIVWIFVVPPREPTLKFIEKVVHAKKKKALIVSPCNSVTHKCVQQMISEI